MKQKGQIQIIFLVLVVIGILLFTGLLKGPSSPRSTQPSRTSPKQETIISAPKEKTPSVPSSVSTPDTDPPYRFNAAPTKDLPVGVLKTTISLETDERAICKYGTTSGLHYDSMMYVFSETDGTFHSIQVTGLSEGGEYKYYIKCVDQYDNKNIDDLEIFFGIKVPEDTTPPERRNLEPRGVLPSGTTETIISVSTDEPAYCRYYTEQGKSYDEMRKTFSRNEEKTYHTAKIRNYEYYFKCTDEDTDCKTRVIEPLKDGKAYDFFVRCKDLDGNKNTGDVMISFSIGSSL